MIKCCYKCTRRWVTETDRCHSTCEDYAREMAQHQQELKAQRLEADCNTAKCDAVRRVMRSMK